VSVVSYLKGSSLRYKSIYALENSELKGAFERYRKQWEHVGFQ